MYDEYGSEAGQRIGAAIAALAINGLLGLVLILGLSIAGSATREAPVDSSLVSFDILPPPAPAQDRPENREAAEDLAGTEGAPAQMLPLPTPAITLPQTPAPVVPPDDGPDTRAGEGLVGQGPGAGGEGSGRGGGGDGGGIASPATRISGALRDRDYPREAEAAGLSGTVRISFRVRTDGRVDQCSIERSSGHPLLDEHTCRLFVERYRFRPARNARGEAVESLLQTSFTWGVRRR